MYIDENTVRDYASILCILYQVFRMDSNNELQNNSDASILSTEQTSISPKLKNKLNEFPEPYIGRIDHIVLCFS